MFLNQAKLEYNEPECNKSRLVGVYLMTGMEHEVSWKCGNV